MVEMMPHPVGKPILERFGLSVRWKSTQISFNSMQPISNMLGISCVMSTCSCQNWSPHKFTNLPIRWMSMTLLKFVEIHLKDLGFRDVNIKGKIPFLLISYTYEL